MIDLRQDISVIIQRRIPEKGWDQAFAKVSPSGGFTEAVKEKILILLIKKTEELEEELRKHEKNSLNSK